MSNNDFQNTINQLSLVMTIPEDLAKACKDNDISPQLTQQLIRIHENQLQLEKAINELRKTMLHFAHALDHSANVHGLMDEALQKMSDYIGFEEYELLDSDSKNGSH